MIEKGYQTLLESAWEIILTLSLDGRLLSSNWAFELMTGWSGEESSGRKVLELVHTDDTASLERHLREVASGQSRPMIELRLVSPQGVIVQVEAAFSRISGEGEEHRLLGVARDITERRRAEAMLRDREERFQELVEGTRAVPFEADCLQRRFTYVGPQAQKLLGYPIEEWYQGNFWFDRVHPGDRRFIDQFPASVSAPSPDQEFVYRMLAADGRTVWLLHLARRHSCGRLCRGFLLDVTARHEAEAELERSRELHRALAARLQLAGEQERLHVAREIHDELGQALTCIRMDALSIRHELQKLSDRDGLDPIAQRMVSLEQMATETMRSVRRISTNLRPPILDRIGLFAAIEWQAGDFEKRFGVHCRLERTSHEPVLETERATAVFRIFQELLTNIARHSGATEVRVVLRQDRQAVLLSVSDNGRGINEADLSKTNTFGVLGMKERAAAFGGTLDITGGKRGTQVAISMPLTTAPLPIDPRS